MTKIPKKVLLSSLIASAVVGTSMARGPEGSASNVRPCGHAATEAKGSASIAAAELLADGCAQQKAATFLRRSMGATTEEAEDATQEAAVRALQREIRSCCSKTFASWLRRTSQNVLFDARKKGQRQYRLSEDSDKMDAMVGASGEIGPEDLLEIRDDLSSVLDRRDIDSMTPNKKAQLGSAVGEHLTAGLPSHWRVTKPLTLLDELEPALRELAKRS